MNVQIKNVNLELSSKCLLACPKCPRTILKGFYDEEDISLECVKQVLDLKPKNISLLGNLGDPIYHKNFHDIMFMFDNYEQNFSVYTNGSGFDIDWWEETYNINKSISKWVFTVDGLEDTAGKYRAGLNFNQAFNAMKKGVEKNKNIWWHFIIFKHNEHQVDDVKKLCKKLKVNFKLTVNQKWDVNDPHKPIGINNE